MRETAFVAPHPRSPSGTGFRTRVMERCGIHTYAARVYIYIYYIGLYYVLKWNIYIYIYISNVEYRVVNRVRKKEKKNETH